MQNKSSKRLIHNGPVFDGFRLHEQADVYIKDGKIETISDQAIRNRECQEIDAQGQLVMPGLVDLHSDSLERSIEKRKGIFFDVDFAILNLDRHLAACGITTYCHAICFADNELGLRAPPEAVNCVDRIRRFNTSSQALVNHKIHIRYEVGSEQSFKLVSDLVNQGLVDMVSIMDHTPGQGQFKSMQSYIRFHAVEYQESEQVIREKAKEKRMNNARAWQLVRKLAETVAKAGIPMLSHDDDTRQKVDLIRSLGTGASEFPVTETAAREARRHGLKIFMGAPNLIRNQSTNGNLKASDALRAGLCDGLMSDYYPESLLQSGFIGQAYTACPEKALKTVTSGPGVFLNAGGRPGQLVPGADADIIIVNRNHPWAHVIRTLVKGKTVYQIQEDN
jgi:alpha-D-ribose 1-methylphosphonate 5-triphosphate diphosphatase